MGWLSEDPSVLAGGLGVIGVGLLIALRLTQQGKYLLWALVALGLAGLVVAVEALWVTDNERVEAVVYDLGRAVARSDSAAVLEHLAPDVEYVSGETPLPGPATRAMIERTLSTAKFDFLRVSHLRAEVGAQSRRGKAEFQVIAGGSFQGSYNTLNFGTTNSSWSLGFRETGPGVWKVNRISPVRLPSGGEAVISTTPGGSKGVRPGPEYNPDRRHRPGGRGL
jgi:hypothetical protein